MKMNQVLTAKYEDGTIAGEVTWNEPETVKEINDNFDDADHVLRFVQGKKIALRAECKGRKSETDEVKEFKKLPLEEQRRRLASANVEVVA